MLMVLALLVLDLLLHELAGLPRLLVHLLEPLLELLLLLLGLALLAPEREAVAIVLVALDGAFVAAVVGHSRSLQSAHGLRPARLPLHAERRRGGGGGGAVRARGRADL